MPTHTEVIHVDRVLFQNCGKNGKGEAQLIQNLSRRWFTHVDGGEQVNKDEKTIHLTEDILRAGILLGNPKNLLQNFEPGTYVLGILQPCNRVPHQLNQDIACEILWRNVVLFIDSVRCVWESSGESRTKRG